MRQKLINSEKQTGKIYGFLWTRGKKITPPEKWHFNTMQEVINEPIVRGSCGIDIGSGCGYDTFLMARENPQVRIVSMDLCDGVTKAKELTRTLKNVQMVKCSILNAALKDGIFDFAYSFGVLHHTNNPASGLLEIARILKKKAPIFLYLYEDHREDLIKHTAIKIVSAIRKVTIRINHNIVYALCLISSPFVFLFFSLPAKTLARFKATHGIAKKIPFNFGTGFFSLSGDLYDRFTAPVEYRFSRQQAYELLSACCFEKINITKLKNSPGLVVWGYKK